MPQTLPRRAALARLGRAAALLSAASAAPAAEAAAVSLPDLIARTKRSVLPVGTFRATDSPRFGFRGTGFVVGDGTLVATNFHVLAPDADSGTASAPQMAVLTDRAAGEDQGQGRLARVVATDRQHDLALLKLDGPPLPALALEEPGAAREGQAIVLMGFPLGGALGFAAVSHHGIVSSVTTVALPAATAAQLDPRALSKLRSGNFEVLQLDATAYPGNSGGPVIAVESGRVLGIVNLVLVKGSRESAISSPTGISYAVPVAQLHALLKSR